MSLILNPMWLFADHGCTLEPAPFPGPDSTCWTQAALATADQAALTTVVKLISRQLAQLSSWQLTNSCPHDSWQTAALTTAGKAVLRQLAKQASQKLTKLSSWELAKS